MIDEVAVAPAPKNNTGRRRCPRLIAAKSWDRGEEKRGRHPLPEGPAERRVKNPALQPSTSCMHIRISTYIQSALVISASPKWRFD